MYKPWGATNQLNLPRETTPDWMAWTTRQTGRRRSVSLYTLHSAKYPPQMGDPDHPGAYVELYRYGINLASSDLHMEEESFSSVIFAAAGMLQ